MLEITGSMRFARTFMTAGLALGLAGGAWAAHTEEPKEAKAPVPGPTLPAVFDANPNPYREPYITAFRAELDAYDRLVEAVNELNNDKILTAWNQWVMAYYHRLTIRAFFVAYEQTFSHRVRMAVNGVDYTKGEDPVKSLIEADVALRNDAGDAKARIGGKDYALSQEVKLKSSEKGTTFVFHLPAKGQKTALPSKEGYRPVEAVPFDPATNQELILTLELERISAALKGIIAGIPPLPPDVMSTINPQNPEGKIPQQFLANRQPLVGARITLKLTSPAEQGTKPGREFSQVSFPVEDEKPGPGGGTLQFNYYFQKLPPGKYTVRIEAENHFTFAPPGESNFALEKGLNPTWRHFVLVSNPPRLLPQPAPKNPRAPAAADAKVDDSNSFEGN